MSRRVRVTVNVNWVRYCGPVVSSIIIARPLPNGARLLLDQLAQLVVSLLVASATR